MRKLYGGGPEIPIFMVGTESTIKTPDLHPMILKVKYLGLKQDVISKILVSKLATSEQLYSYIYRLFEIPTSDRVEIRFGTDVNDPDSETTPLKRNGATLDSVNISSEIFSCLIIKHVHVVGSGGGKRVVSMKSIREEEEMEEEKTGGSSSGSSGIKRDYLASDNTYKGKSVINLVNCGTGDTGSSGGSAKKRKDEYNNNINDNKNLIQGLGQGQQQQSQNQAQSQQQFNAFCQPGMSEEEQLKLAMEMSLAQTYEDSVMAPEAKYVEPIASITFLLRILKVGQKIKQFSV